jgi:hypothetical protein
MRKVTPRAPWRRVQSPWNWKSSVARPRVVAWAGRQKARRVIARAAILNLDIVPLCTAATGGRYELGFKVRRETER